MGPRQATSPLRIQGYETRPHRQQRLRTCRRSTRLQKYYSREQDTSASEDIVSGIKERRSINLPSAIQAGNPETLHGPLISSKQRSPEHKRLHPGPGPERPSDNPDPPSKRSRTSKDRLIEHWTLNEYKWPQNPSKPDIIEHCLARPKTPSLRRMKPNSGETISQVKSRPYTDKNYEVYLETKGSFMGRHKDDITRDSKDFYQKLLMKDTKVPRDTVFDDKAFRSTCDRLRKYNETGVIRIIGELIVPSAESAIDLGHVTFPHLIVSMNDGWDSSIPLDEAQLPPPAQSRQFRLPQPQPDYAVGFSRQSFTENQLKKLAPFVGEIGDMSYFMSTAYMYFPFMTAEVKCGMTALDIADRQNAHSMTLSVRGVVKLFRVVKREKELHQQILSFSISHDHQMVRIYGHYPVIDGDKTVYHRHPIHQFSFTALDGKEKWTSYKFVMGMYDDWAPSHFKRLCSAIDELPEVNLDVSQQPDEILPQPELSFSESSGF
ncbi:hypothetical protein BDBG_01427 [Blastomyces gilchristii SLH14081]|uniref:DUF7924 domain-containing protein n=1 Tax=Blastomyces gilchristii (strain SLH14081) TaxID=559298 RepID=A0A179UAI1_BLAGS|nr:uncharacterized protein BDBG_01427 [Blastomyces gilchristii SLH14081]EQL33493.1 hypothetical protein BDFG_04628 [Blastomyces dermatitidis ATCC 26199]OAT04954.1 hypothetical protein BDBG_01427 [Blastomyces gilchristii SLH14081]